MILFESLQLNNRFFFGDGYVLDVCAWYYWSYYFELLHEWKVKASGWSVCDCGNKYVFDQYFL